MGGAILRSTTFALALALTVQGWSQNPEPPSAPDEASDEVAGTIQRASTASLTASAAMQPPPRTYVPVYTRRAASSTADPVVYLFPQDGRLRFRGWLDSGTVINTGSPNSRFNGPYNAVDRSNEPMFNQSYMIAEMVLPQDGAIGVGGRVDMLYGEDFLLAQSVGFETKQTGAAKWNGQYYGLALPQIYGEIGNDLLSVKLGHFYSIVGYEGVQSVGNFFYSHAYSYQFAGPFTHWGGLATAKLTDQLSIQAGLTNGWNGFDRTSDRMGMLAGVKYASANNRWWTSTAVTTGDELNNPAGLPGIATAMNNRTRWSNLLGLNSAGGRLEYVFHQWYGFQRDGQVGSQTAKWYGIDQYLYMRLNNQWRVGGRFEWFRDEQGTRVGLNRPSNPNKPPLPGSYYSFTYGLNWTPRPNVILRPEMRTDWHDGNSPVRPFRDGQRQYQLMLGMDAIVRY